MFTEGLDETAISWINQESNVANKSRSPLTEKYSLDSTVYQQFSSKCNTFLSSKVLPPVKFHSVLLSPHSHLLADSEKEESVASVPEGYYANYSDTFEGGLRSSGDSDLFEKPGNGNFEEEIMSGENLSCEPVGETGREQRPTLIRGISKENLRVLIEEKNSSDDEKVKKSLNADTNTVSDAFSLDDERNGFPNSHVHILDEFTAENFQELGTPSAPPILANRKESSTSYLDCENKVRLNTEVSSDNPIQPQEVGETSAGNLLVEQNVHAPMSETNLTSQISGYNSSVQSAWQTFIAYDACLRLCLNAWARDCMEAPEFLRDECMTLRNAFGLQTFLLHPRGQILEDRIHAERKEGTNFAKGRKIIGQLEVEVKRIRLIPKRRKLRSISSHRTLYMQMGVDYVKKMSEILKSQINLLRATYEPIASEEFMHCFLQLKNSSKDAPSESDCSSVCLKPGAGDSHVFYLENQGDSILIEVQDINQVNHGHAAIPISSFIESHGEVTKWFPLYLEEHGCVGKLQLSFTIFHSSDKLASTKMLQGGPVVETMIYDLVLEAAMRAQNIHSKNLHIHGHWKWLLNEFADYYGVSNAYTKLRFLSSIMSIATPIKECLELIHELLLPIIKARGEKSLTRQERSILLDCEDQINNLLTTTFENYKSLDELSPTGLSDTFGIILVSAAPALLLPSVQIFTLLHDILSQEAQNILRNYLQIAAARRCRRHMVETDEFISGNGDALYTDHMTVSTAYLKMKMLCLNISNEIQEDIKIHNQHIFPSSIDLPSITASIYSTELCKRLRGFLAACPPSKPAQHVAELLIASADFERDLDSWNIRSVHGGFISKDLFHHYILVWIQDTQLQLLELCKSEKMLCSDVSPSFSTSTFVEHMYEQIAKSINEYEVVISRWPQYLLALENAVAEVERATLKALEKQHNEIIIPLRDGIPKILEKQVQRLTWRQSISFYVVPNQLGIFLNTVKRILDVLHPGIEHILKCWASCLTIEDGTNIFGEQMNGFTVTLRKKYKKYIQAIVEKLVCNTQSNRTTRLKRILEEAKEAAGESEIRERMQTLCLQLTDSIHNLHRMFASRIFVTICRGFWDKMGQIILTFLESRKENRIWYRGSDYALGNINNLTNINELNLANNKLTGLVPDLSGMNYLNYVDLSNNTFDPPENPAWFSELKSLTALVIQSGGLSGEVPETLFNFPQLQQVILDYNHFNGTLQLGTSVSRQLQLVSFINNNLSELVTGGYNESLILVGNPVCNQLPNKKYCTVSQQSPVSYSTSVVNCVSNLCPSDQSPNPQSCSCAYPFQGVMYFIAPLFRDVSNRTLFQELENQLRTVLGLTPGSVFLQNPFFNNDSYMQIQVKIFPSTGMYFSRSKIQQIGFDLSNQTFKPPQLFGPYYFIASTYPFPALEGRSTMSVGLKIGITACCALLVIGLLVVIIYALRQRRRAERAIERSKHFGSWTGNGEENSEAPQLKGARWFSYEELKRCTNNFSVSNVIGSGGYGKVYRGMFPGGQIVAIKRAQQGSTQGALEFKTEIELLSRVHHKNLVSLVGFCFDQGEQMLVYEFVPNGTLRESLSGKSGILLDWRRRLRIALGSARGLAYLHELADPPIIHRDVKPSNILLDENLNAKVADFGLSKLISDNEKGYVSTQVKGTLGYFDPEYYMTQQLTDKTDVYSFGVVMLEMITAKQPIVKGKYIVNEVKMAIDASDEEFYGLKQLMDPVIQIATNLIAFRKYIELALRCLEELAADRPTMSDVVKEIEMMLHSNGLSTNSQSASSSSTDIENSKLIRSHPYISGSRKDASEDAFDYSGGYSFSTKLEPK